MSATIELLLFFVFFLLGLLIGYFFAISKTRSKLAKAEERNEILSNERNKLVDEITENRKRIESYTSEIAKSTVVKENLEQKLDAQKNELEGLQKKFIAEFENLANKILEDKSKRFTEQNKENITTILDPLRQKISDFEKRVNEVYDSENKGRAALSEQLRSLQELNKTMSEDANNLTRALKGDSKQQGNWGEFILESILEKSGLVREREFSIQEVVRSQDGALLRPDIIINLPENKSIIIDSKVSLKSYEEYSSTEDENERRKSKSEFLSSIKRHIKGLSPKEYQNLYGLQSLDFVLMFVPIEPAFALAVQAEPNLFNEAFDKNIVIVSPSTLLATLRTIASIWKNEKQNRNAFEIARQSGALYDKFVSFVEDLIDVGKRIDSSKESYQDAMKKLYEGSGNLIRRVENIRLLGAKTSKSLPSSLLTRAEDDQSNFLESDEN